jgi:hypothetical protein
MNDLTRPSHAPENAIPAPAGSARRFPFNMLESSPRSRSDVRKAWLLAIAADWTQIVLMPLFAGGAISPANDLLDVIVAVFMVKLLGWHPAFLPTFIAELVPGLGLFPTWTISVWFATRGLGKATPPPERTTP